jgi:predicted AAA+ superfamily ATPase
VVVCTGSSSVDLVEGAVERWPGRRGSGDDHLVLPQTFGTFAKILDANVPPSPMLTVGELVSPAGRDLLLATRVHDTSLRRSFERYLEFGGLPAAIAEASSEHLVPSRQVKRVFIDSMAREVARHGLSEPAAYALIERIARSLSSEVNWSALGRDMDVPLTSRARGGRGADGQTVRKYVERFAATYFAMVLYAWKGDLVGNDLARDKKLYFGDPILYGVARDVAGVQAMDVPAAVENVLALALFRRYEPQYAQMYGFGMPTRLHFWRSSRGTEIDFLAGPRSGIECVEVKYQNRVDRRALSGMLRAFPGRPSVIASKDELELRDEGALIPAHVLAWALG